MAKSFSLTNQFKQCGNAFRVDTYTGCNYGCKYCFANTRNGGFAKNQTYDVTPKEYLQKFFTKAFESEREYKDIDIEILKHRVPMHVGGLSDPFQEREWSLRATYDLIEITNKYNYPAMFSTKTAHLPQEYWDILNPDIHAFQISLFTNDDSKIREYETNTPLPSERIKFIKELHNRGFWVGLRIQPLIYIEDAINLVKELNGYVNYITVEHLKIPRDNMAIRGLFQTQLDSGNYIGNRYSRHYELTTVIKRENILRLKAVTKTPIGCGDNDLHELSDSRCCCGIDTINSNFDNWLKYNLTYFLTGNVTDEERKKLWTPCNNCKKCLNGDAVIKDKFLFTEYVDLYEDKYYNNNKMEIKKKDKGTKK